MEYYRSREKGDVVVMAGDMGETEVPPVREMEAETEGMHFEVQERQESSVGIVPSLKRKNRRVVIEEEEEEEEEDEGIDGEGERARPEQEKPRVMQRAEDNSTSTRTEEPLKTKRSLVVVLKLPSRAKDKKAKDLEVVATRLAEFEEGGLPRKKKTKIVALKLHKRVKVEGTQFRFAGTANEGVPSSISTSIPNHLEPNPSSPSHAAVAAKEQSDYSRRVDELWQEATRLSRQSRDNMAELLRLHAVVGVYIDDLITSVKEEKQEEEEVEEVEVEEGVEDAPISRKGKRPREKKGVAINDTSGQNGKHKLSRRQRRIEAERISTTEGHGQNPPKSNTQRKRRKKTARIERPTSPTTETHDQNTPTTRRKRKKNSARKIPIDPLLPAELEGVRIYNKEFLKRRRVQLSMANAADADKSLNQQSGERNFAELKSQNFKREPEY